MIVLPPSKIEFSRPGSDEVLELDIVETVHAIRLTEEEVAGATTGEAQNMIAFGKFRGLLDQRFGAFGYGHAWILYQSLWAAYTEFKKKAGI